MRPTAPQAACLLLLLACLVPATQAQTVDTPFAAGPSKLFAHSSADDLSAWMNPAVEDGAAAPFYLTGEPAFTDPVAGVAVDPVAQEAFEARIPLQPGLNQSLVLDGTVTVQAYIGGGSFTGGVAEIATSLVADGKTLGAADAQQHVMTPKAQAGTTYDAISCTFTLARAAVPAGAKLEWVISGTADAGNNLFMSTYPARGSSYIELPVATAGPVLGHGGAPATFYRTLTGASANVTLASANATTEHFQYNWTAGPAPLAVGVHANLTSGSARVQVLQGGRLLLNQTLNGTLDRAQTVVGDASGNWTVRVDLTNFTGSLALRMAAPPTGAPPTSTTAAASHTTATATTSGGPTSTSTSKTPGPGPLALLAALALAGLAWRGARRDA